MGSLKNAHIRVCASEVKNVLVMEQIQNKTVFSRNGIYSRLYMTMQEHLGISYDIKIVEDYGNKLPNGTWTGKIGALYQNECDLALPVVTEYERTEVIDFTTEITSDGIVFFIRKPGEMSKIYAPIYPFAINVWIASVIALLVVCFVFNFTFHYYAKISNSKTPTAYTTFWALVGSFANKDHPLFDYQGPSQWISATWLLAFFVLMSSYSGALMSFIAFPGLESVPETFKELADALEQGRYTASTLGRSILMNKVVGGNTGINLRMRKMWNEGRLTRSAFGPILFKKMQNENHAFMFYNTATRAILGSISKNLITSKDNILTDYSAFATRKDFRYKREFNTAIRRCVESGLVYKYYRDVLKEAEMGSTPIETNEAEPLQLKDIMGALVLLIMGYILSIVAFLLEIIIMKVQKMGLIHTKQDC